jgi:hypothetical protein
VRWIEAETYRFASGTSNMMADEINFQSMMDGSVLWDWGDEPGPDWRCDALVLRVVRRC